MSERAYVEIRSQKSIGGSLDSFGGPNRYVAVQVVPDGATPLRVLNQNAAKRRGIRIVYFGEGYSRHVGPRSALGRAIAKATEYAKTINGDA